MTIIEKRCRCFGNPSNPRGVVDVESIGRLDD
jgi:hypothetical protein